MDESYLAALSMAALEVLPAQPSDLTSLLGDPDAREVLLKLSPSGRTSELLGWLCDEIDIGRVELWHKRIEHAASDLGAYPVLIHQPHYPRGLVDCWDAPPMLFVRGRVGNEHRVAVVGSREADPDLVTAARVLACTVAAAGAIVVSGLAAGVDSAAHQGALDAGGHTIAVMGTGIRRVFPSENTELAEQIAATGALISQFAPAAPRTSTTFLYRNNVIAGLADVNVVMSGRERSGSRHEADQAIRYGRRVLLWQPALGGEPWALRAVADGDAEFITDARQVVECLTVH